jgi:hypothetical protein
MNVVSILGHFLVETSTQTPNKSREKTAAKQRKVPINAKDTMMLPQTPQPPASSLAMYHPRRNAAQGRPDQRPLIPTLNDTSRRVSSLFLTATILLFALPIIAHHLSHINLQPSTGYRLPRSQTPMCIPVTAERSRAAPQCRQSPATVIVELCQSPRGVCEQQPVSSPNSSSPRSGDSNRKLKTEMCKNMLSHGYCCWGNQCLFAHSEDERMKFTSVEEMYEYGLVSKADVGVYLSRVCSFWVQTGSWCVCILFRVNTQCV